MRIADSIEQGTKECGNCKYCKWKCIDTDWNHEFICELTDRITCGYCNKWEIKNAWEQ